MPEELIVCPTCKGTGDNPHPPANMAPVRPGEKLIMADHTCPMCKGKKYIPKPQ